MTENISIYEKIRLNRTKETPIWEKKCLTIEEVMQIFWCRAYKNQRAYRPSEMSFCNMDGREKVYYS